MTPGYQIDKDRTSQGNTALSWCAIGMTPIKRSFFVMTNEPALKSRVQIASCPTEDEEHRRVQPQHLAHGFVEKW